ncbi:hypothetical protein ACIBTP_16155 [Streptomyces avidinii]
MFRTRIRTRTRAASLAARATAGVLPRAAVGFPVQKSARFGG